MIVLNFNDLEPVWISWKLSDITQFSWSIIQTEWVPQMTIIWISFGLLFSRLKYSKIWMWVIENENRILVFSKLKNWNSVASCVNKMRLWVLKPVHCHIRVKLWVITVGTPLLHFISPPNFQQNFSLFSLPSLSLFSFSLPSSSPTS